MISNTLFDFKYYFFFFIWLFFIGCNQFPAPSLSEKISEVYHSTNSFDQANQLRYAQDYAHATLAYQKELATTDLSTLDSLYLINQLLYCQLIINKRENVEEKFALAEQLISQLGDKAKILIGDYNFNKGRYLFLKYNHEKAVVHAHQALQQYTQYYPSGHLKIAQTLTLLALIHKKDGSLTDSIQHYALQSNEFFLTHPELKVYDWENDYVQANAARLNLAHQMGAYYCRATLQKIRELPFDNSWQEAWALNLLGRMVKKRADSMVFGDTLGLEAKKTKIYQRADSIYQAAISLGKKEPDIPLASFYTLWVINAMKSQDSSYFFQTMKVFENQFEDNREIWQPHFYRLMGRYYYYHQNQAAYTSRIIKNCQTALALKHQDPTIEYQALAESYYYLRIIYSKMGEFEKSAFYAKKSLLLYNCLKQDVAINQLAAINQLDGTKRYSLITSGFFASGLLMKYQSGRKKKDLDLANAYFNFVEKHSFESLLKTDENTFLTFQKEVGNRIFIDAMQAAYETWQITRDKFWIEKVFNYMEYLKSYLLYRDMLKSEKINTHIQALSDSIRVVQGIVNQMLFQMIEPTHSPIRFDNSHLLNRLSSLENQRKELFDISEIKGFSRRINLFEIQKKLSSNQGILNYFYGKNELFTIYIDADTLMLHQLADPQQELKKTVKAFRNSIEKIVKPSTVNTYLGSANILYNALLKPFEQQLHKVEQLVVIPDQLLTGIPFEALLKEPINTENYDFKTLPYLLHQFPIVYTSSWKIFELNQKNISLDHRQHNIGFWTTPELNANNNLNLIEQSIQVNFSSNYQIFNQKRDGKHLFLAQHSRFDILHLLLHASSSNTNRFDNHIQFGYGKDNLIYGFDMYKQKFNTKLLVLASCESASGTSRQGEGTFSLARSFINSGVPEVIAAQYLIPQTTTGPLLGHFYKHLGQGHSASKALYLAKIEYLKTISKDRHAFPHFWAGMVVFN